MIVEFVLTRILLSYPPQFWLYYKTENEMHFNKISLTYELLKIFLETYGYETNNILEFNKFGVDTKHIKYNINLK